jgi:hypothetical protein
MAINAGRNHGAACKRCDYRENLLVKKRMKLTNDLSVWKQPSPVNCDVGLKSLLRSVCSFYFIKILEFHSVEK